MTTITKTTTTADNDTDTDDSINTCWRSMKSTPRQPTPVIPTTKVQQRFDAFSSSFDNDCSNINNSSINHQQQTAATWESLTMLEHRSTPVNVVELQPSPNDVVLGRGKPIQDRPANHWFRTLLESYKDQYETADRQEKTVLAAAIVQIVKNDTRCPRRFLRHASSHGQHIWEEVDDITARAKVSYSFRTIRRHEKN